MSWFFGSSSERRILAALAGMEQRMNARITTFQTQMTDLFSKESTALDGIKTEEAALKQQIADLQAKQDAGTFGPDDQAALDSIESQYAALVARAQGLVDPPPTGGTPAA